MIANWPNMAADRAFAMMRCSYQRWHGRSTKGTYGEDDRCALAAAYAFGVVRNHPFINGNKRTG